jgi:hypothetical protein
MIDGRMRSGLDAKEIDLEHIGFHKQTKETSDTPVSHCDTEGICPPV